MRNLQEYRARLRYRRVIPADLRAHFDHRTQVTASLPDDRRAAELRCQELNEEWDRKFAELRDQEEFQKRKFVEGCPKRLIDIVERGPAWRLATQLSKLTNTAFLPSLLHQLEHAADADLSPFLFLAFKPVEVHFDEWVTLHRHLPDDQRVLHAATDELRQMFEFETLGELPTFWNLRDPDPSKWTEDDLAISVTSAVPERFYRAITEAVGLAFAELFEDGALAPNGTPATTALNKSVVRESRRGSLTISEVHEDWKASRDSTQSPMAHWETAQKRFVAWFGDLRVKDITRSVVLDFQALLRNHPRSTDRAWKELDGREQWRRLRSGPARETLSQTTVRHQVNWLKRMLSHAEREGMIERNPAADIQTKVNRRQAEERLPFTHEDLDTLLHSPVWSVTADPDGDTKFRSVLVGNRFALWIPILALYTGLRLTEITRLKHEDIWISGQAIPYISVTRRRFDEQDKNGPEHRVKKRSGDSLKTDNSPRRIPIHAKLLEAGIKALQDESKRSHSPFLLGHDEHAPAEISQWFSRAFGRYLRRMGIKQHRVSLYSLRHNFAQEIRAQGATRDVEGDLLGHAPHTYGSPVPPLPALSEAIQSLQFGGISTEIWVAALQKDVGLTPRRQRPALAKQMRYPQAKVPSKPKGTSTSTWMPNPHRGQSAEAEAPDKRAP